MTICENSWGFAHQVEVIAHQAPRMDLPVHFLARVAQGFQEQLPVAVVQENGLPPIAAVHDVVNRTRILHSELPGHSAGQLARSLNLRQAPAQELVKISGSDPATPCDKPRGCVVICLRN